MIVSSRLIDISAKGSKIEYESDENEYTDIMVPYADMLNHKDPKMASWSYSMERKGFII